MKKLLLIILSAAAVTTSFAGDFDGRGVISGWKFAPVQVDVGLINDKKLVDNSTDTFFSLGLWLLQQKSAVISFSFVVNTLHNNYGISCGWLNYCKNCYGIQLGIVNYSWAGEPVEENRKRLQVIGMNIADTVYVGVVNISNKFQIGAVNLSAGAIFQLGLLNYNPKSYIPWMPLVNWDMGREVNNDSGN